MAKVSGLDMTDAKAQVAALNAAGLALWGRGTQRIDFTPVSMQELERVGLDAYKLGILESQADLDTVQNYTIGVFAAFSLIAVVLGIGVGGNTGASLAYVFAAVPLIFLSIGSVAPGIIVGLISQIEGGKEGKGGNVDSAGINRRVRHEAAHFLVGYLLGLPIAAYEVETNTSCVEFHPTVNGEIVPNQRLSKGEIDKLSVVALSGAVGEALNFNSATGGGQDLELLQRLLLICEERMTRAKQEDQSRWGALSARMLLRQYDPEYQALCKAFAEKKSVPECMAILETARK